MQKTRTFLKIAFATLFLGAASCSKDIYNAERHHELIKYVSPVDSVDQNHTWKLTDTYTYSIDCNVSIGTQCLEIYNANPVTSKDAELMRRVFCNDMDKVRTTVVVPATAKKLYAALVNQQGLYTVAEFDKSASNVSFSEPVSVNQLPYNLTPKLQTFTYCYEEDFPEPGDYDYNDVVMRISMENVGPKTIDFHLSLAAVGSTKHLAGAMRFVGCGYKQEVVSVEAERTYNENLPKIWYGLIENDSLLLKGQKNEAVLNLFADAHWAMGENLPTVNDEFKRKKYNVVLGSSDDYQQIAPRTRTYRVNFSSESVANNISMANVDPFIMTFYIGAKVEIHIDEYRNAQTFYDYSTIDFKDLPWAFEIPSGSFQYPREGIQIGFRKKSEDGTVAMFGAYVTQGHSFGEWVEDHNNYLDWYNYPVGNQVYPY